MSLFNSNQQDRAEAGRRSSREIKHDIDRTLAEMDDTVGQLQGRMSVRGIARELTGSLGGPDDTMVSRTPGRLWDAAKANPGPATLLGLGIAWLVIDRMSAKGRGEGQGYEIGRGRERDWLSPGAEYFPSDFGEESDRGAGRGEPHPQAGTKIGEKAEHLRERAVEGVESLKDKASDAIDSMKARVSGMGHSASSIKGKATERASELKDHASEVSKRARERLHEVSDQVQMRSSQFKRQTEDMYQEAPLAFGAAALAIGVGLGLAVPSTRKENELLGRRSDRFKEKAKEVGENALQGAKQVAQDVVGTVKQGLSGDDNRPLGEKAKDTLDRVVDATKDRVKQSVQSIGGTSSGGGASNQQTPSTGSSDRAPSTGGVRPTMNPEIGDDVNVD